MLSSSIRIITAITFDNTEHFNNNGSFLNPVPYWIKNSESRPGKLSSDFHVEMTIVKRRCKKFGSNCDLLHWKNTDWILFFVVVSLVSCARCCNIPEIRFFRSCFESCSILFPKCKFCCWERSENDDSSAICLVRLNYVIVQSKKAVH